MSPGAAHHSQSRLRHPGDPMKEFAQIAEIMKRRGATCSPKDFHAAVNLTFHKWESTVYDELHGDIWESLPGRFRLLVADYLSAASRVSDSLHVLDVGCGTGLASDCLMRTDLAKQISSIDLLDTSSSMLYRASQRAKSWNTRSAVSKVNSAVLQCSAKSTMSFLAAPVMHHVVDLLPFLNAIRSLQEEGGIFIDLQDRQRRLPS